MGEKCYFCEKGGNLVEVKVGVDYPSSKYAHRSCDVVFQKLPRFLLYLGLLGGFLGMMTGYLQVSGLCLIIGTPIFIMTPIYRFLILVLTGKRCGRVVEL